MGLGLPTLPNLSSDLAALPNLSSELPSLSDVGSAVSNASSAVASAATSAASSVAGTAATAIFGIPLTNAVMIVVGLLLIAAGIFSFDKTRELIVKAGKAAAKGTEAAATAA